MKYPKIVHLVMMVVLIFAVVRANAQITIREKIQIGQPGVTVSSVGGDSLHALYSYRACGGWSGVIRITTPCGTSYEAVGPPSDQYQTQSVYLDIPVFEPGTYDITTRGFPIVRRVHADTLRTVGNIYISGMITETIITRQVPTPRADISLPAPSIVLSRILSRRLPIQSVLKHIGNLTFSITTMGKSSSSNNVLT